LAEPAPISGGRKCIVLGAGGHGRVVIDCLLASGVVVDAVLDSDRRRWGSKIAGIPVLGDDSVLLEIGDDTTTFAVGVGAVGKTEPRQRLFRLGLGRGLEPQTVCHPSATVSRGATLVAGAQVLPGAIINTGARIGANAIVNSGAIVEHDCDIGDHAHVATGARLGGDVRIGAGAFVGIGATVRNAVAVGENAVVGAGAVVVKEVAAGTTVAGVPAAPLK